MESTHMSLLDKALQEGNYELAALLIVYGLLKVIHDGKETDRRPQGQPECPQTRVLQPGA
jgi:hypothetical protein